MIENWMMANKVVSINLQKVKTRISCDYCALLCCMSVNVLFFYSFQLLYFMFFLFVSEIPLFHVLNARITFGNIFALDSPVEGVTTIDDGNKLTCVIDDTCFQPPPSYTFLGNMF